MDLGIPVFRNYELFKLVIAESTWVMLKIFTFYDTVKLDELVKSRKTPFFVIPAKAGIQFFQLVTELLDSGFHRSDDFLRDRQA